MSLQVELLATVVERERAGGLTATERRRRSAARLLEAIASCCRGSFAGRLLAALDGPATGCCIAG